MEGVSGGREGWMEGGREGFDRPRRYVVRVGRKEREGWGYFVAGDEQDYLMGM